MARAATAKAKELRPSDIYPGVEREQAAHYAALNGRRIIAFREVEPGESYLSTWREDRRSVKCTGGPNELAIYTYNNAVIGYKPKGPRCIMSAYDADLEDAAYEAVQG